MFALGDGHLIGFINKALLPQLRRMDLLPDERPNPAASRKQRIVLDEGLLFRTNERAFVETKRRLLDECDLWCVLSLPGGVFTTAGAGVKTNLLFFTKGRPTRRIWFYDLSGVRVGKLRPAAPGPRYARGRQRPVLDPRHRGQAGSGGRRHGPAPGRGRASAAPGDPLAVPGRDLASG